MWCGETRQHTMLRARRHFRSFGSMRSCAIFAKHKIQHNFMIVTKPCDSLNCIKTETFWRFAPSPRGCRMIRIPLRLSAPGVRDEPRVESQTISSSPKYLRKWAKYALDSALLACIAQTTMFHSVPCHAPASEDRWREKKNVVRILNRNNESNNVRTKTGILQ